MHIDYVLTTPEQREILRQLWQFYMYDFPYMGWQVQAENGRFYEYGLEGCWEKPGRDTYLFKINGAWAGFAILDQREGSLYTDDPRPHTEMTQFFIMATWRSKGVGRLAALELFSRYRGCWEVFQLQKNTRAQAFWRRVIGELTKGNYREILYEDEEGVVQLFENGA